MKTAFPTDARLAPPDWLVPAQAREWISIVNSLPADYFRPSDAPMLAAFCCASAAHRECVVRLEIEGITIEGKNGYRFPNPLLAVMSQQSSTMSQLATKLRLCPSARIAKGEKSPKGQIGQRPWGESKVA